MSTKGRGREPGFRMSEEHRLKIANSNVLNYLLRHIEGKREMSATQVSAGIALLKKVIPDLSSVTVGGDDENPLAVVHRVELVAGNGNSAG